MRYPVDNALFQWEEGERRLREAPELERVGLERACALVLDELRRRLGSSFTVEELADLYGAGADWAGDVVAGFGVPGEASCVIDASFGRYARAAANFGGGRRRGDSERF